MDLGALARLRDLLGDRPRRRDLLIEFLHLIQDAEGHLSAPMLRALAEEMRLSQAEIYEVASFYAHFDPVAEDEAPPPPLTIRVCESLSCELAGADALARTVDATGEAGLLGIATLPAEPAPEVDDSDLTIETEEVE